MRILLAATGRMKKGPERELCARYLERSAASARQAGLTGVELREFAESQARTADERKAGEAGAMLAAVPAGARLVLLEETGRNVGSRDFAADIATARDGGAPAYVLAIGGPDGHGALLRMPPVTFFHSAL